MSAAGSSSLGGEGNYAKTFNNQDSENFKRFEKGGKENDIEDKDQTASQIQSDLGKQESHADSLPLLRSS